MATLPITETTQSPRALHYALWTVQALLAFAFFAAGAMKTLTPIDQLVAQGIDHGWALTRFIGVSELAGAVGLILPSALRIQPWLTPLAASGLATIMVLAAGVHAAHGQVSQLPPVIVLGALAAFVVWGRSTRARILA